MSEEENETKKVAPKFGLVNVATQEETMIQTPSGEVIDTQMALVKLLNEVAEIKSLVG
jgi:hypothetical protein